eukprot:scaffold119361_cov68-Phaeocystis_antarctica.AAC.2
MAVKPQGSLWSGLAEWCRRKSRTERWPLSAAFISGVSPRLLSKSTLAPRFSSSLTITRWPLAAAMWSGPTAVAASWESSLNARQCPVGWQVRGGRRQRCVLPGELRGGSCSPGVACRAILLHGRRLALDIGPLRCGAAVHVLGPLSVRKQQRAYATQHSAQTKSHQTNLKGTCCRAEGCPETRSDAQDDGNGKPHHKSASRQEAHRPKAYRPLSHALPLDPRVPGSRVLVDLTLQVDLHCLDPRYLH